MLQQLHGWTTRRRGVITAQAEPGHPNAVLLDSGKTTGSDRFDGPRFTNGEHGSLRLSFLGSRELTITVKLRTSDGDKKLQLTADERPGEKVSPTHYRLGIGARAGESTWGVHTIDVAALVALVDPGVTLTELVRVYVRIRDRVLFDPPVTLGDAPPPPPSATGPANRAEAARFLVQATFGPTEASIDDLMEMGSFAAWIDEQLALEPSTTFAYTLANSNGSDPVTRHQVWWANALGEPDQLRQRVAFALSEIFVVSDNDYELSNSQYGICHYYDMLSRHVTGNFRDLLTDVTLHPSMGVYLGMLRNQRADPSRNIRPDENYARELLQLFTIGLSELDASGRPVERDGAPVPTFDQGTIESFARVFTGWNFAGEDSFESNNIPSIARREPMEPNELYHDVGSKALLSGVVTPANQTARADLDAALDNVFAHPNVGPFIARRLIQRLVSSNPSPDYIGRVAARFADDGTGMRGSLAATVEAILLDPEARDVTARPAFGKPREPILRLAHLWRAMEAVPGPDAAPDFYRTSEGGMHQIAEFMAQAPMESPSVFNFFRPDYSPSGSELTAPEMQILTEANLAATNNALSNMVYVYNNRGDGYEMNTRINVEREIALAADPSNLLEHLDVVLLGGSMSDGMRTALTDHLLSIPIDDDGLVTRALDAIFAAAASPAFCIQK